MKDLVSILTVRAHGHDPFRRLQKEMVEKYTDTRYEHLFIMGGNKGSYSHGEGLDKLTQQAGGDIVVAMDSDAFPIRHWTYLLDFLDDHKAVAVKHSRYGYAHPCFFAVKRNDLEDKSWQRVGDLDVGRALSYQLKSEGPLKLLEVTDSFADNPDPLDPPIGAIYDDTIFHNWYTSRLNFSGNPDGISRNLIEDSIKDALRRYQ